MNIVSKGEVTRPQQARARAGGQSAWRALEEQAGGGRTGVGRDVGVSAATGVNANRVGAGGASRVIQSVRGWQREIDGRGRERK
jgi:hypothetical protein